MIDMSSYILNFMKYEIINYKKMSRISYIIKYFFR